MNTDPVTPDTLARSVVAVPPLARRPDLSLDCDENVKIIRHIEAGGVATLLYGGNANFYHLPPGEFGDMLAFLGEAAADDTLVIPSVGPAYGMMMEQAKVLARTSFPTAMVLPQQGVTTPEGVEAGVRRFVEAVGKPALLYLKNDGYIDVENVRRLMDDGVLSVIKYAVVRDDPARDEFLRRLVEAVDPKHVMSGIGEQPAPTHLREFGLGGFTSGCVCVAPRLSMEMLRALQAGDDERAKEIRATFRPLEDLRNAISPIRVLHEAVRLAEIAETGPLLPLLSNLEPEHHASVEKAARELRAADADLR